LPNDCSILNTSDQEVIKSTIKRVHLAPKMRWTSILVFETLKTKCMAKRLCWSDETAQIVALNVFAEHSANYHGTTCISCKLLLLRASMPVLDLPNDDDVSAWLP
jgi:hypothetical protein